MKSFLCLIKSVLFDNLKNKVKTRTIWHAGHRVSEAANTVFFGGVGVIFSYTQRSLLLAVEHCRETTVLITPSPLNCSEARKKKSPNPLTSTGKNPVNHLLFHNSNLVNSNMLSLTGCWVCRIFPRSFFYCLVTAQKIGVIMISNLFVRWIRHLVQLLRRWKTMCQVHKTLCGFNAESFLKRVWHFFTPTFVHKWT